MSPRSSYSSSPDRKSQVFLTLLLIARAWYAMCVCARCHCGRAKACRPTARWWRPFNGQEVTGTSIWLLIAHVVCYVCARCHVAPPKASGQQRANGRAGLLPLFCKGQCLPCVPCIGMCRWGPPSRRLSFEKAWTVTSLCMHSQVVVWHSFFSGMAGWHRKYVALDPEGYLRYKIFFMFTRARCRDIVFQNRE